MKQYALTLHIFRRDLRLQDNTALIAALAASEKVIPCFIFDPRQVEQNDYKSDNCIQFMLTSLQDLAEQLKTKNTKLYYFYGPSSEVIERLLIKYQLDAIYVNEDYTPFSIERDKHIAEICKKHHVDFLSYPDLMLHAPGTILKANREPYTIFTPYYRKALTVPIDMPKKNMRDNYFHGEINESLSAMPKTLLRIKNLNIFVKGGRKEGLSLVKKIPLLDHYQKARDIPYLSGTSHLSAHNKFGTISIREVYQAIVDAFNKHHALIQEIMWRDFFMQIGFYYPGVYQHAFQEKFRAIRWSQNEKKFQNWCEGMTGFPIVDAGMRELNVTGFMHNRVRMIVASFLCKDLHINWRWGEKYFAQQLVDYDPAVNNGNWQWAASTGCDAQPYFRIFNPWLQQKKFDPECLYIKKWLPEIARLSANAIHQLFDRTKNDMIHYPHCIVDHTIESQKAKTIYAMLK